MFSFKKLDYSPILAQKGNIESLALNFSQIFENTPLQKWYESGIWNVSNLLRKVRYLCDASRAAYLYKNGGIYMDTDIICLKNLELVRNALGYQSSKELNGAFLSMEKGHPFMKVDSELLFSSYFVYHSWIFIFTQILHESF